MCDRRRCRRERDRKVAALIAGMAAGADSIDDLDLIRPGGMAPVVRRGLRAGDAGPFLREFTYGTQMVIA